MVTTNGRRAAHSNRSFPFPSTIISKCNLGFILSWWIGCLYLMSSFIGCSQQNDTIATSDLLVRTTIAKDAAVPVQSSCQAEYNRIVSQQTPGLTPQDLLRSRALIGNQYRLEKLMEKLSSRERPVVVVVAGGSISLGHGLANPDQHRYSNRLENWMNEMYPLPPEPKTDQDNNAQQRHKVINVASHGADSCSMAKRLNVMYSDLASKLPSSPDEPDLIILEFAVNDYEGQDHLVQVRYQASVFFDGFMDITLCSEVVIYSLLKRYKNTAIVFLEMQTAILPRKTGALLHMGVATHYQIPVISYAETLFHGFAELIRKLEKMDPISYSFLPSELVFGSKENNVTTSALFPYPHGCSPCQPQNIVSQFRHGGCKSICTFVDRSNIVNDRKLKCKANDIKSGRKECFVPYLAPDAVHPSAVGHGIATDLLVHTLASAQRNSCEGEGSSYQNELPMTTFVAKTTNELEVRGDFLVVNDAARIFSRWDRLKPIGKPQGFERYADDSLKQRPGWIATDTSGGSKIIFPIDLPPSECYVVYVAILKSYAGMGTMMVEVRDYGNEKNDSELPKHSTKKKVDALWQSPISVWNDVQITDDNIAGCTGYCEVDITTDPTVSGRNGNKVKILTVSARRCSRGQT